MDVPVEALEAKKHKGLDEAMAITDVDPEFFTKLSGRVVKEKFSMHSYVEDNREIFKTRLLAGQILDDCIRIEQQFIEGQRKLDKIKVFRLSFLKVSFKVNGNFALLRYFFFFVSNTPVHVQIIRESIVNVTRVDKTVEVFHRFWNNCK